jgi:hypothetical protein
MLSPVAHPAAPIAVTGVRTGAHHLARPVGRQLDRLPRVILRVLGVGLVAALVGAVHLSRRPATFCTLRALTGIPCPFCGGTTAVADLGHAHIGAALRASPLAVALAVGLPFVGAAAPPRWWARRELRVTAVLAVLAGAELWQLARFGVLL